MSIVVTTPTGHIGRVVVEQLLAAGETGVSVIVRDPSRLAPDVRERVAVHQGDLADEAFVTEATQGAEALFWLTPPSFTTPDWKGLLTHSAYVGSNAVRANRIPYVVHLSSAGADHAEGFGPVSYLQIVENALAETGAHVLNLRPGFFYENFLQQRQAILEQGAIFEPFAPEVTYPLIATRDIGVAAADRLLKRHSWPSGASILGLHGPAPTPSFGEAATIIGDAIGRPVKFVQVPIEAFVAPLRQMGASESVIVGYTELLTAVGRGESPAEPRTPETTTPTTLYEWARETFAPTSAAAAAH
jgi:uncharacterized protein YbjT (DUF2867 family)